MLDKVKEIREKISKLAYDIHATYNFSEEEANQEIDKIVLDIVEFGVERYVEGTKSEEKFHKTLEQGNGEL